MTIAANSKRRQVPARTRKSRARTKNHESVEFRFLTENARELEAYPGEVLLIHGARLIAHSPDFAVIRKAIQENQIQSPFIYRVPASSEANFIF
ncbi:MAG: hypothetical protein L0Y70_02080 [Gemmataceae bacterium]|nr:hypothetical protein [Gemmataceae bacterium]